MIQTAIEARLNKVATNVTNKAFAQVQLAEYGAAAFFSLNPLEVKEMIKTYAIEKGFPKVTRFIPKVVTGFMYINDEPVGRICGLPQKTDVSEDVAYWEGRILARQEMD